MHVGHFNTYHHCKKAHRKTSEISTSYTRYLDSAIIIPRVYEKLIGIVHRVQHQC